MKRRVNMREGKAQVKQMIRNKRSLGDMLQEKQDEILEAIQKDTEQQSKAKEDKKETKEIEVVPKAAVSKEALKIAAELLSTSTKKSAPKENVVVKTTTSDSGDKVMKISKEKKNEQNGDNINFKIKLK